MPIYEYTCASCGQHFEIMQRMNAEPERLCSHCGKETLQKRISAPSVQFKGTGWYVTDYKKPSAPTDKKNTTPEPSAVTSSESKVSEKPAATEPSKTSKDT